MITIGGRVLMTSALNRTEIALAELGCASIKTRPHPRVLTAGLGLGYTLRAILDTVSSSATIDVAELNEVVIEWTKGPIAALTDSAVLDPRVNVIHDDVMKSIHAAAAKGGLYDAIVLDLYVGPGAYSEKELEHLYGARALKAAYAALTSGGMYAVWGEEFHAPFEKRLRAAGFEVKTIRSRSRGPHYVIYLAERR